MAGPTQESLSPITEEPHLDSLVGQLERPIRCQEQTNFETVELLCWFEEAKYTDLELVVVHSCEVWVGNHIKILWKMRL